MEPVQFDQCNVVYGGPGYRPLPAFKTVNQDGHPCSLTCWELSDEEVADLVKCRKLWLVHMGEAFSPMIPLTKPPLQKTT